MSETFAPKDIAERWKSDVHTPLRHIAAGRLRAINVGTGSRPRWRITEESLAQFEAERSNRPIPKPPRRQVKRTIIRHFRGAHNDGTQKAQAELRPASRPRDAASGTLHDVQAETTDHDKFVDEHS